MATGASAQVSGVGPWIQRLRMSVLAIGLGVSAGAAWAAPDPAALCEAAAHRAAQATGVPVAVLLAVALTESGRSRAGRFRPWPWTLNIEGAGMYFDTRAEALARAEQARAAGRVSFDSGCFQINYRWHGEAFESLDAMIDPDRNARYAAEFLGALYQESGDWTVAAGHYHSRTPVHAARYREIFTRHYARLDGQPLVPPAALPTTVAVATPGPNEFPLLQAGGRPSGPGSLVPARPGRGHLFAARPARSLWGQ